MFLRQKSRFFSTTRSLIDFDITTKAFKSTPLHEVILSAVIFKIVCDYPLFTNSITTILKSESKIPKPIISVLNTAIKSTVFKLFTGGESITDCMCVIKNLKKNYNVRTILDFSVEEVQSSDADASWDMNLKKKCDLLDDIISNKLDDDVLFIPIKCTSMICPLLLEKLTSVIPVRTRATNSLAGDMNNLDLKDSLSIYGLSYVELKTFNNGLRRLSILCEHASKSNVSLLFDAEQSHRQPAIEIYYRLLAKKYNKVKPVVYNTYQLYLKRTLHAIELDIKHANANNYILAAKVVRGAYMQSEKLNASMNRKTTDYPIRNSKTDTDLAYNESIRVLLQSHSQGTSLIIATHNRDSIIQALQHMNDLSISNNNSRIFFAQIKGMCDNITNLLGLHQYNSLKLISYGSFQELLPWILRRLEENESIFGAMQQERYLLVKEITDRVFGRKGINN